MNVEERVALDRRLDLKGHVQEVDITTVARISENM